MPCAHIHSPSSGCSPAYADLIQATSRAAAAATAAVLPGSLLLAQIMISGQVFAGHEAFTTALAVKKVSVSFGTNLVRGMLCNWLVCMAIWQANAAQDIAGKVLGVFLPVSAFVTGGFEHCVANM